MDAKNPATGKLYTGGEILEKFSSPGMNRLAVKIHYDERSVERSVGATK